MMRNQKSIKLLSSKDLLQCIDVHNGMYICPGRQIAHLDKNLLSKCNQLPNSIIIELSPNSLLIKTETKNMLIICKEEDTKNITLDKEYSVINLKSHCRIEAKDFTIKEHYMDKNDFLLNEPFKIINYDLDMPERLNLKNNTLNLKLLDNITAKINNDIEKAESRDEENKLTISDIKDTLYIHDIRDKGLIGALPTIIIIIITTATITYCCKNRRRATLSKD